MSEDQIGEVIRLSEPGSGEGGVGRNAIEGGMGGRLSEQEKRGAEEQRREPAMDAAAVKRLELDFPGIGRIDTTGGLPAGPRSRSTPVLGMDSAGVKELEEMFPGSGALRSEIKQTLVRYHHGRTGCTF